MRQIIVFFLAFLFLTSCADVKPTAVINTYTLHWKIDWGSSPGTFTLGGKGSDAPLHWLSYSTVYSDDFEVQTGDVLTCDITYTSTNDSDFPLVALQPTGFRDQDTGMPTSLGSHTVHLEIVIP